MAYLNFDAQGFADGLIKALIEETDVCLNLFVNDATRGLTQSAKDGIELEHAHQVIEDGVEHILAVAVFGVEAVLESYGIGSGADKGPMSYWQEYVQSDNFNRLRISKGNAIIGRPEGEYTDPWGRDRYSSGKNVGKNIEGWAPVQAALQAYGNPSRSIQEAEEDADFYKATRSIANAEKWIMGRANSWIERRLIVAANRWIEQNSDKYFSN